MTQTMLQEARVRPDRATLAYHDFLLGSKLFWSRRMYNALKEDYRAETDITPDMSVDELEARMREHTLYQFFGWFERHLQRFKYSAPLGIAATVDKQREELEAVLEEAAAEGQANGYLRLNPAMPLPRYYTSVDFHQHPGGVWSDNLAGLVYEFGRKTTTPMHLHEDDLHYRLAAAAPVGDYRRILDWGCGIGKSTYPFVLKYPQAEVYGIDASAPCLKLAYLRDCEAGRNIFYSQQDIEQTDFPDNHFDLIHSTFMLHELPPPALKRATAEAFRILKPGGYLVHLDFHSPPGGLWGQFIHYGHARRNNEVFMRAFCQTDFLGLEREIGFTSAEMRPFDDGTGAVTDPAAMTQNWRFPWQLFVAQK